MKAQILQNDRQCGPVMPTILQHLRAILMGVKTICDPSNSPKSYHKIGLDNTTTRVHYNQRQPLYPIQEFPPNLRFFDKVFLSKTAEEVDCVLICDQRIRSGIPSLA